MFNGVRPVPPALAFGQAETDRSEAVSASSSLSETSSARMALHSFQAMMKREKSSSTVDKYIQPQPMILK